MYFPPLQNVLYVRLIPLLLCLVLLQELASFHTMQQLVLMPQSHLPSHLPSPSSFLLSQSPNGHQGAVLKHFH